MKILEDIYIIGGGENGIGISNKLDCNIFLIDCGTEAVLIDSGVGVDTDIIFKNIENEKIDKNKIKKLILTHAHLDHAGGAQILKKVLDLKIYMSEIEAPFLENADEKSISLDIAKINGIYPKEYKYKPVKVDIKLKGTEKIKAGKYIFKIISTPGHSRGSICVLLEKHEKKVLFTGDTVFTRGLLGMLNTFDSSLSEYKKGIANISKLKIDSLIPGHFGFTLNSGSKHINMASDALKELFIPRMIF
jgi:hydroxyacylglutathione hydrolase